MVPNKEVEHDNETFNIDHKALFATIFQRGAFSVTKVTGNNKMAYHELRLEYLWEDIRTA